MPGTQPLDPFIDERFSIPDFASDREPFAVTLARIANEEEEAKPLSYISETGHVPSVQEILDAQEQPDPPVQATPSAPLPPEEPEPQVTVYPDGSKLTVEKTKKGWRSVLDPGTGVQAEVFYGKTQNEMWANVAAGKINATRKIRELNRKAKLQVEAPPPGPPPSTLHTLTADEIFDLKNKLGSDPAAALETWFEKRTGRTLDQVLNSADRGQAASEELYSEGIAKQFLSKHPEYHSTDENYSAMVAFMAKSKLRIALTPDNQEQVIKALIRSGHWTLDNLSEAFEELSQDGLLDSAPEEVDEPEPVRTTAATPVATPPVVTPTPDPRIVGVRRIPRASLGIRTSEANAKPVDPDPLPSAEDLESLSDQQIAELLNGIRRQKISGRRS